MFKTADGWLTLSLADGGTLAKAFGDPQFLTWTKDDQFDQRETVNKVVASHMVKRTTSEWEEIFAEHGMWSARVNGYDEVLADPQVAANQSILDFEDPNAGHVRALAHPIRYDGEAPGIRRTPPGVGQHTDRFSRNSASEPPMSGGCAKREALGRIAALPPSIARALRQNPLTVEKPQRNDPTRRI